MSTERIAVTGVGAVSALAVGARATFERLLSGERAVTPLALFDPGATRCRIAAQVHGLDPAAIAPRELSSRFTRSDALALLAAREALADAGVAERPGAIGLAIGATTGGMFETENDLIENPGAPLEVRARRLLSHPLSATAELLGAALPGVVQSSTICSACSSSAVALVRAAALLRTGAVERVLAGGTDGLSRLTFLGFDSLGALDPEPCRPFDAGRRGLNLGEGAAFLVLERESLARARGAGVLAFLSGEAVTAEAHHITHPEPSGALAAALMRRALERAALSPADVGYVNAHGTGTQQNDAMEARALHEVFGDALARVAVSSSKAQIGHTLGAAGALEAVISVLSLERGLAPPTSGLEHPEDPELSHVVRARPFSASAVVSCSFGFGGTGSVLVFERPASPPRSLAAPPPVRVVVTGRFGIGRDERDSDPSKQLDPERSRRFDRGAAWPALASSVLLESARLPPAGVAVVLGTAYGSVERSVRFLLRAMASGARMVSPAEFPHLVASAASGNVSIYAGLTGPALTVVAREAPHEESLATAALLLADGHAAAAIAGVVSPPDPISDAVLGGPARKRVEGGGFVLLETHASAASRGAPVLAELAGAWSLALPETRAPHALTAPRSEARALVLAGELSDAARAFLDASSWAACARESALEDGFHEAVTAVAMARAVDRLAVGEHDEILIASGPASAIHLCLLRSSGARR